MTGHRFERMVRQVFEAFISRLGFTMAPLSISGRVYSVHFTSSTHVVSVSYEPGDEQVLVTVSPVAQNLLSDYDDRARTPRLGDLNARYMKLVTDEERLANHAAFSSIVADDKEELRLLKSLRELCLVLPRYLRDAGSQGPMPGAL